jgi:hypothetical protein
MLELEPQLVAIELETFRKITDDENVGVEMINHSLGTTKLSRTSRLLVVHGIPRETVPGRNS